MDLQRGHAVLPKDLFVRDRPHDRAGGVVARIHHRDTTGGGLQCLVHAQIAQRAARIRCDDQTGADLPYLRRTLIDHHPEAAPLQRKSGRQAADAGADDDDPFYVHGHKCNVVSNC